MTSETGARYRLATGVSVRPFDVSTAANACLVEGSGGARWEVSAATGSLLVRLGAGRSAIELADAMGTELGAVPDSGQLAQYLDSLRRRGIVAIVGDVSSTLSAAPRTRLASLTVRATLIPERWAGILATPLQWLMTPVVFWPATFVVACAAIIAWSYAGGVNALTPSRLFVVGPIALALLGGIVHELGHVAAARRFGAAHGRVGVGLYLVFPVFFVELDDVWHLTRTQRSIVDLAGIYLQLLFAGGTLAIAQLLRETHPSFASVASVAFTASAVNAVVNLNPVFRFDGYWLLGDALGIANLRLRSVALLQSLLKGKSLSAATSEAGIERISPTLVVALLVYSVASMAILSWWLLHLVVGIPAFVRNEFAQAARTVYAELTTGRFPSAAEWLAFGMRTAVVAGFAIVFGSLLRHAARSVFHSNALQRR